MIIVVIAVVNTDNQNNNRRASKLGLDIQILEFVPQDSRLERVSLPSLLFPSAAKLN